MKYKNYNSAIHNFAHSFMSIDYMKSGRLAVNVLIDLQNKGFEAKAKFDFVNRTIQPSEAVSSESKQLFNDYLNWLPDHFVNHNCDLSKIEKLEITIWADIENAKTPKGMDNSRELIVNTLTNWKSEQREEKSIEISQSEIVKVNYLKLGIPEFI